MDKLFGYVGKMLFVDLSEGSLRDEILTRDLTENFLGGYGIGAKILYDNMPANTEAFSEDSILGFVTGPATGTGAVMSGRFTVVCKSPVTNLWNDANSGGHFGPELKKAGYDAVFIKGKAKTPVYLWIKDGQAELRDAKDLWGKSIKETEKILRQETGETRMQSAAIGPAGENLSYMAAIMNDEHRAAGRAGSGAVMGWKNLKAVVCKGSGKIQVADVEAFKAVNARITQEILNPPKTNRTRKKLQNFQKWGTSQGNAANFISGDTPVKNWGGSGLIDFGEDKINNLDLPEFDAEYNVGRYGCANCAIRCGAHYEVKDGKYFQGKTDRPEYETWSAFGPDCLNGDRNVIFACNEICNEGGLDTIAAGSTIAWAMEAYDNGVLTKDDLDGLEVPWGDGEVMLELLRKMIAGEGVGKKLMNGQRYAIKAFGRGEAFETTAGGVEPGMHDGRFAKGYNRIYQYDPTPGRHMKGGAAYYPLNIHDRPKVDVDQMTGVEILNCAGFCAFGKFGFGNQAVYDFLTTITGIKYDEAKQDEMGKKIYFMRHLFNLREGQQRKDMTLAPRLNGPLKEGPNAGVVIDTEKLADDFYNELGWDTTTLIPGREVLEGLGGLEFAYEFLYGNDNEDPR